jgi:predicted acetyltransferase
MRFAKAAIPFFPSRRQPFIFFEPGRLVDGDLELLPPSSENIESVMAACEPGVNEDSIRRQLIDFVKAFPDGRQPGDRSGEILPTYHFWMQVAGIEMPTVGGIGLRIGNSFDTVMYYGHIGYHVYAHARGHRYALRSCQMLLPLALKHGLDPLWITCNPDNFASRRTCELLGAKLVEIIPVPEQHALYQRGDLEKCRYRLDLR